MGAWARRIAAASLGTKAYLAVPPSESTPLLGPGPPRRQS
jgi:hypothetical protein